MRHAYTYEIYVSVSSMTIVQTIVHARTHMPLHLYTKDFVGKDHDTGLLSFFRALLTIDPGRHQQEKARARMCLRACMHASEHPSPHLLLTHQLSEAHFGIAGASEVIRPCRGVLKLTRRARAHQTLSLVLFAVLLRRPVLHSDDRTNN